MRQLFIIIILSFIALDVHGQLKGVVTNGESFEPLTAVTVTNLVTGQATITGAYGYFTIAAAYGDKVSFSFSGFHTIERICELPDSMHVILFPISVRLPEYTLHELTKFQRDSIEKTALFSKELTIKPIKAGFSSANGGGFTGLIGGPVQKMSRSYKRNKKFKENFRKDMEQGFIDTRYKPTLVTTLTGLTGDQLITFMNTHPMDYAFARAASELELKAWIRDTYKEYRKTLAP